MASAQACEPYGSLDLQSDSQSFSMHFGPEGKVELEISTHDGEVLKPEAYWECENGVLTVFNAGKRSVIKRFPMLVIAGSITIQNRLGKEELFVFAPTYW